MIFLGVLTLNARGKSSMNPQNLRNINIPKCEHKCCQYSFSLLFCDPSELIDRIFLEISKH